MLSEDIHILATLFSLAYTALEIAAIATAVLAVRDTRTPQGAVAWAISLVAFPVLTLPFYWVFGRRKFRGYVEAMREGEERVRETLGSIDEIPVVRGIKERKRPHLPRTFFETVANLPFLGGNDLELLIDGEKTFDAIFHAIDNAKRRILIQFFIVHADGLGNRLKNALMAKAAEGIKIFFLYDEIGCHATPLSYWQEMRDAGIEVHPFHTRKGRGNRFQLNFRNHRKIVVVDGHTAFVGGHNVGDEYLGLSERFEGWRDTHIRISGPAVIGVRMSFAKDWYWATREMKQVDLTMPQPVGNAEVLTLPTGPADPLETCSLMFIRAINEARDRFWIASPYYVPDSSVTKALQLAAMRGVDVRIMLPRKADHLLVYLAGFACLHDLDIPGIRIYRYDQGFLHQKVFLVDDKLCGIGTANLDNRSFRLNFEITMLVEDKPFCKQVETMFEADFARCVETGPNEYSDKSIATQTLIRFVRLLSPVL